MDNSDTTPYPTQVLIEISTPIPKLLIKKRKTKHLQVEIIKSPYVKDKLHYCPNN